MLEITEIDRSDEPGQRTWYDLMSLAWTDGRPDAVYQPFDTQRASLVAAPAFRRVVWLLASEDGRPVGAAELSWSTEVDPDRADLAIGVAAGERRRGVGRALAQEAARIGREHGRTVWTGHFHLDGEADPQASAPAQRFADALGGRRVHTELHLVLDLPPDPARLAALRRTVEASAGGYEALSWTDHCPDDHVEAYLAMRTQMDADVPLGEAPPTPRPWTVERLRSGEQRRVDTWVTLTAVARHRATGELGGYSELLLPRVETGTVWQEDTLVMPEHRGHRLGLLVKLATLDLLLGEHPASRAVHTWVEPNNTAMLRSNAAMGYRTAETMIEVIRD